MRDAMDDVTNQLEALKEQVSQHLNSIGAYQPLACSAEENTQIIQELYCSGYNFYENAKYREATDFFKVLTQIDADSVHHWLGLAASLQMQKLHNEALLAYATAIVLDPTDQTIFFHAANCCFALKHVDEGLKALDMAEQIASGKPEQGAFISQLAILREAWSNVDEEEETKINQ